MYDEELIAHAHDRFARATLTDPRVARDLFTNYLPEEILHVVDLEHLKIEPTNHIIKLNKSSTLDLLFKTKIAGQDGYLYLLLEHQSSADPLMPFRIFYYIACIISHHLKTTKEKTIPLIYPLVLYHGDTQYPYTNDIRDLVKAPRELVDKYFLKPFQIIDLSQIHDEKLREQTWSGVVLYAMKHIFAEKFTSHFKNLFKMLSQVIEKDYAVDFANIVLEYASVKGNMTHEERIEVIEAIRTEGGKSMMSIADIIRGNAREEGEEEGRAQGKAEVAKRLLLKGFDPNFVVEVSRLPLAQVNKLKEKIT